MEKGELTFEQQREVLNRELQRFVAFSRAMDVFGSAEAAKSWWNTGNPHLRGRKPSTCAPERVLTLLQRIDRGLS